MILKSELKQVPVEQRVPGRVYGVGNTLRDSLNQVRIFASGSDDIEGIFWAYWFALPESMLPVREVMPQFFDLKEGEWEYTDKFGVYCLLPMTTRFRRKNEELPELTIPSGTKSEQIAELEKILAELKQS
jgi:hypothetical protein